MNTVGNVAVFSLLGLGAVAVWNAYKKAKDAPVTGTLPDNLKALPFTLPNFELDAFDLPAFLQPKVPADVTISPVKNPPAGTYPLGIRNNNPGNLRPLSGGQKWQGQTGTAGNFLQFDTPANGLRAAAKNLLNQQRLHGLNTVRKIITKYAPIFENPAQASYISTVAKALGVSADAPINLENTSTLVAFLSAVVRHENGQQPYSGSQLTTAANAAKA